jgi:hypothetical protein
MRSNHWLRVSRFVFLLLCATPFLSAQAEGIKELMVQAIEMDGETVSGELSGETARYVKAHTRSQTAVKVEAKLIERFDTEGCGRVQIQFYQNTPLNKENSAMQFPMEMNYCIDGSIPSLRAKG